jgi:hypothetical protein
VAGQAVSDVVHLLAELIENATSFSPPGTKVQVAGQQVSNGYVLEIEDRGLGMSDDELVEANERLANPPVVDFALSRMLGLYVVARLAQRYDIKVQLRHSWYGGITALVLLPPTVAVRGPMPEAIEAPSQRGPAELVASSGPAEPAPPAAEETGDHLPIFEAARSDWFEDGVRGDHLPLRRHAAQQPGGRGAEPTGNGAGADTARAEALRAEALRAETARMEAAKAEAARTERAPAEPGPAEPVPADATAADATAADATAADATAAEADRPGDGAPVASRPKTEAPPGPTAKTTRQRGAGAASRVRTGSLPTRTPGASGPPPGGAEPFAAPATVQAASVQTTKAGLPRRVPRANLAPGMVAAQAAAPAAQTAPAGDSSQSSPSAARSPEEVRSMLSSYRSGLERGRMMAAGEDADRGGDAHSSSRSDDDDATQ